MTDLNWIDYPTETGWWWMKQGKKKPRICNVVEKRTGNNSKVVLAIFPEKETSMYLDKVYSNIVWQKVKSYAK